MKKRSSHGIPCERPVLDGMKAQHDIVFGDAPGYEFFGNAQFRAVFQQPDLPVSFDVEVNEQGINEPAGGSPARCQ